MVRTLSLLFVCALIVGCSKKHPVSVFVDPDMAASVEKIAVLHFASSLHDADDPDEKAPRAMDEVFRAELDGRNDYRFIAPTSVDYAISSAGMEEELHAFVDDYRKNAKVDAEFLKRASEVLQADAVLIGVVDLWQQNEVDYRENAAPTTYVGATVSIIKLSDGKVMFRASDEDFIEGARSEERSVQTSTLGAVRRDDGARVYAAPDPLLVADKVARALVASIPLR